MRKIPLIAVMLIVISVSFALEFFSKNPGITGASFLQDSNGSIEVLFCPKEDCRGALELLINSSEDVECAFYSAEPEIIALIARKNHRVVIDRNNYEKATRGLNPDADIISVYSEGIMHNKFCVFDGEIVLTGSANPTKGDTFRNNNNIVIIKSSTLAKNYREKIRQLFIRSAERYEPKTAHKINVNGTIIENYFCPEDLCSKKVLDKINSAESEIYFMTFSFTDDAIGEAIIRKNEEGIRISGIFDSQQISNFSEYQKMKNAGLDVILDSGKYLMHHKVFIIDNKTVITGSFNPSANANYRNDENILIINNPEIAREYLSEFEYVKKMNISS
jgi:phosphatidylserine/phosphatidylglycerophosphate/cardiolipin synthase-like enzyme